MITYDKEQHGNNGSAVVRAETHSAANTFRSCEKRLVAHDSIACSRAFRGMCSHVETNGNRIDRQKRPTKQQGPDVAAQHI